MEGGVQRKSSEVRQHTGWKGNGSCLSFLDRLCLWGVGLRKRWLRAKEPQEMDVEMWGTQADLRQESNFRHWDFHSGFQIHLHKGFLGSFIFSLHCEVWFRRSREGPDLSALDAQGLWKPVWVGRPLSGMQSSPFFLHYFPFCFSSGCLFAIGKYMAAIY